MPLNSISKGKGAFCSPPFPPHPPFSSFCSVAILFCIFSRQHFAIKMSDCPVHTHKWGLQPSTGLPALWGWLWAAGRARVLFSQAVCCWRWTMGCVGRCLPSAHKTEAVCKTHAVLRFLGGFPKRVSSFVLPLIRKHYVNHSTLSLGAAFYNLRMGTGRKWSCFSHVEVKHWQIREGMSSFLSSWTRS